MITIKNKNFHPIASTSDHLMFCSNGNVVLGYRLDLPEIYSLSEKDFEELHSGWFQAFKTLPTGTLIHKQDYYHNTAFDASSLPDESFLGKATQSYFNSREYTAHTSYLFFVLTHKSNTHATYTNPFRKILKNLPNTLEDAVRHFTGAVEDAVSFLNSGKKIKLTPLKPYEYQSLTQNYFNGFNENLTTDILLDKNRINIGKHLFDVLAVNSELCFGEQVKTSSIDERFTADDFQFHKGFIDGLGLTLSENHVVNQILILDDKHKWRKILDKKVEELGKSSSFGSQNRVVLKKIQEILEQTNTDESSRVIRGQLSVLYWAETQKQLDAIGAKIKTEFKELDIVPYYPIGEARKNYFLNSWFGFASHFSDEDLYVTDLKHALCLMLNSTNYKTDPKGILFNDRQYTIPVLKDVWDESKKRIKARNFAIFAPTGEGKSFLANNILRQFYEEGVRLVIIDLGGSYTKFAKLYPDEHIILRYEAGKNLGINPFYTSEGEIPSAERLEDLTVFLFELYHTEGRQAKAQSVSLKKILTAYYRANPSLHSLNGFYDFVFSNRKDLLAQLKIHPDYFDIQEFLHVMSEYVGDGLYSYLFEVDEDQTYTLEDKRMIIFELDEVKDNKEILSVMLKLIKTAIQRTIWKNKAERGIILFDEFAKQLKFENVLESVEFYYQAIRKQNGAIGIILQSINQLPGNATSASILENTQVIYSLNNEKGYDELARRLNLSSHDLNQLKSIRNKLSGSRKYTEIFIKIGKESNIFRLEVPPEVYAAYLTDGSENELILSLYEQTQDMEAAINQFISPSRSVQTAIQKQ
ncbi:TraG family conjugative transposon ATPase [Leeuwenhoekiella polynyae]|uniref:Conjugation system TraG family ATPase n=1 Tax=Leeuwenhoekiella polynyae TaxID=1550906 RepID=A0A4Q0P2B0_9FLAO|nr:TraG family conjugative transposon ATPase [Leeuwenhoekiella polynyae]RXG20056.1 conjugation system TraG family ATPase [Leeuwenhoekiella polynyae]